MEDINIEILIDMYLCPKPIEYRITEKVDIPYLREKLLPRSAHAMFCIPSEPFSADVRSDARCGSKTTNFAFFLNFAVRHFFADIFFI